MWALLTESCGIVTGGDGWLTASAASHDSRRTGEACGGPISGHPALDCPDVPARRRSLENIGEFFANLSWPGLTRPSRYNSKCLVFSGWPAMTTEWRRHPGNQVPARKRGRQIAEPARATLVCVVRSGLATVPLSSLGSWPPVVTKLLIYLFMAILRNKTNFSRSLTLAG